jgi:transcriptional regulator with XRE-family HTH domain
MTAQRQTAQEMIKEILELAKHTQKDLADKLGAHEEEVSRWSRGLHIPNKENTNKIRTILRHERQLLKYEPDVWYKVSFVNPLTSAPMSGEAQLDTLRNEPMFLIKFKDAKGQDVTIAKTIEGAFNQIDMQQIGG